MTHTTFEITPSNFQAQVLDSPLPVLVDFTADWCPPCKMLAPIVDELAQKYPSVLRVGTVDGDAHPFLTQRYGVMGLPTLILFQNGTPVERIIGFRPRSYIEARLTPHMQPENA